MANYISKDKRKANKDGKLTLTPRGIYKELIIHEKVNLIGWLIVSALFLVLSGMFVFILSFQGLADERWNNVLKLFLLAAPFVMAAGTTLYYLHRIKNVSKRSYSVISDTVERVVTDDRTVVRHRHGRNVVKTEHAMYLYHCGRVVISLQETYTNSEGDVYYVVVEDDNPDKAVLLFSAKKYDLVDISLK